MRTRSKFIAAGGAILAFIALLNLAGAMTVTATPTFANNAISGFTYSISNSTGYNGTIGFAQQVKFVIDTSGVPAGVNLIISSNSTSQSPIFTTATKPATPPTPKWNINKFFTPSFNSTQTITNATINATFTFNAIPKQNLNVSCTSVFTGNTVMANTILGINFTCLKEPKLNINATAPFNSTQDGILVTLPNYKLHGPLALGQGVDIPEVGINVTAPNLTRANADLNWTLLENQYIHNNPIENCTTLITKNNFTFCGDKTISLIEGYGLAEKDLLMGNLTGGIQDWLTGYANTWKETNAYNFTLFNTTNRTFTNYVNVTNQKLNNDNTIINQQTGAVGLYSEFFVALCGVLVIFIGVWIKLEQGRRAENKNYGG